jgi:hypothetical protein
MSADPLYDIQTQIQTHLGKGANLKDLPTFLADKGDLIEQVSRVAAIKGIAISIEPVDTDLGYSGDAAMFSLVVGIVVTESVMVNRSNSGTQRRCSQVVADIVKHFRPQNSPPCMLKKVTLKQDSGGRCEYLITGIAKEALK